MLDLIGWNSVHFSFVAASYIITFLALLMLVLLPRYQKRQLVKQLKRQQRIESVENQ